MAKINLLARDFDSIKQELINILAQTRPALANALSDSNVLQIFLNFFAFIGDVNSHQIDLSINEAFIDTAVQFESLTRIGKLVGVVPKLPTPSVLVTSVILATPATTDIIIPQGTTITYLSETFEVLRTFVIPAGLTSANGLTFIQGKTVNQTFTATGDVNEVFVLSNFPVTNGSITVTTAFGEALQVESLALVDGPENKYEIDVGEDFSVFLRFGDNVNGAILPANSSVQVSYRTLNLQPLVVLPNAIQTTVQGTALGTGLPVNVTVFNPGAAITGTLGDSTETLKNKIKAAAQRVVTKITHNDLNSTIINLGIVSAVNVARHPVNVDVIQVFVWKRDSVTGRLTIVPQVAIDSLIEFLDTIRPINVRFEIVPGTIIPLVLKVKAVTTSFDINTVTQSIKNAMFTFFALVNPGTRINPVDIVNFIHNQVADLTTVQVFDASNNLFSGIQLAENELSDLIAVQVDVTS